jgi:hypothetical protein
MWIGPGLRAAIAASASWIRAARTRIDAVGNVETSLTCTFMPSRPKLCSNRCLTPLK